MSRKDGYGEIYFTFFDKYLNKDLSKSEKRIIEIIMRYSWFCKKSGIRKYAIIPERKIFKVQKINDVINKLVEAKVIFYNKEYNLFSINANVDQWTIPNILDNNYFEQKHSSLKRLNLHETPEDVNIHKKALSIKTKEDVIKNDTIKDNIIKVGLENKNIEIYKNFAINIEKYCIDIEAKLQAISDVSKKIEIGELEQNPERIHIIIKKYYNQIMKQKRVAISKIPIGYDSFLMLLDIKQNSLKLSRNDAIKEIIQQKEIPVDSIKIYLEYEKSLNQ